MSDGTKIEWTDATWNVVNGCSVISPGCKHCYAMKQAHRFPVRQGLTQKTAGGMVWTGEVRFNEAVLIQPLRWKRPRRIFVCAHGDLFHPAVPDEWIDRVFAVMALAPHHTFQVLTKRPERAREYTLKNLTNGCGLDRVIGTRMMDEYEKARRQNRSVPAFALPLPNVWLGVSVEDQTRANERIPLLLDTPAAVRWLSMEPLLGPVDVFKVLACWQFQRTNDQKAHIGWGNPLLDWIVLGGESGPSARPMHPDWARSVRDQCAAAGVPFLFKQWGDWTPGVNAACTNGRPLVQTADWFNDHWSFETINGDFDFHADDEPLLYRTGKKAAGRLLDGVQHDGYPER